MLFKTEEGRCVCDSGLRRGPARCFGSTRLIIPGSKCNLCHIYEYPALWGYARVLYRIPGIAATCDIDECKLHYYGCPCMVNPSGVVPTGLLPAQARVTGPADPATSSLGPTTALIVSHSHRRSWPRQPDGALGENRL